MEQLRSGTLPSVPKFSIWELPYVYPTFTQLYIYIVSRGVEWFIFVPQTTNHCRRVPAFIQTWSWVSPLLFQQIRQSDGCWSSISQRFPPKKRDVRSPCDTVDGQNPAPVGMVNIPLFTRFYKQSQVVQDFVHQQYVYFWVGCFSDQIAKKNMKLIDKILHPETFCYSILLCHEYSPAMSGHSFFLSEMENVCFLMLKS